MRRQTSPAGKNKEMAQRRSVKWIGMIDLEFKQADLVLYNLVLMF